MPRGKNSATSLKGHSHLGFEALEPVRKDLATDTAQRVSANRDCAATWRDLCGAQDHRSNPLTFAAF